MDWIDVNNLDISHFGIDPDFLPMSNIRFDTFHMKCSITRKLMTRLRKFILDQSIDLISRFMVVLSGFWVDFLLFVWHNNKKFTSFNGNELSMFVKNISSITQFIDTNFVTCDESSNITRSLNLWNDIYIYFVLYQKLTQQREIRISLIWKGMRII